MECHSLWVVEGLSLLSWLLLSSVELFPQGRLDAMPLGRCGEDQGLPVTVSNLGDGSSPGEPWDETALPMN